MNDKAHTHPSEPPIQQGQYQTPYHEDEIDLADLVRILIREKKIIFLATLVTTLGALVFAFYRPIIYKPEIFFRPPSKADVELLNSQFGDFSVGEITDSLVAIENFTINKDDLFQMFLGELRSRNLRREIFNDNYPVEGKEKNVNQLFDEFNKKFNLNLPNTKKNQNQSNEVSITFEDNNPQLAANILNILGKMANNKAVKIALLDAEGRINVRKKTLNNKMNTLLAMKKKEISDEIIRLQEVDTIKRKTLQRQIDTLLAMKKKEIDDEIIRLQEADNIKGKTLQAQIAAIKEQAQKRREDRIARLDEAASIAKDSQIENQLSLNPNEKGIRETLATVQVSMNTLPLYLYGEKVLRAEIKRLKERKSDEPFLTKLRGLEEQLTLLKKNERIEALKVRKDLVPFLAEVRKIQSKLLEKNETIEALKARKDLAPFMPEAREIQKQLTLLDGISFDQNMIRAAIVEQAAYPPVTPKSTKGRMIVALGLILGLMMGVFAAFLMNFVGNMRQEENEA